ncbi:hypothetical protein GN244_ATG14068 [Phytophthora infestans]|uniref:Uncharacterized protein n=1 Tax=Phytophthora infestans TaxID=4787 RepID=A0A833SG17_PHYIN|nr:hypothetical protein GN244_ATG14068 [Phytophthora infestans]
MQNKLSMPRHQDWLTIKCLLTLLTPFATVTEQLSGQSYPTLPLVLPVLFSLEASLKNRSVFDKDINPVDGEEYAAETRVVMNECRKVMLNVFIKCFAKRMRDEPK